MEAKSEKRTAKEIVSDIKKLTDEFENLSQEDKKSADVSVILITSTATEIEGKESEILDVHVAFIGKEKYVYNSLKSALKGSSKVRNLVKDALLESSPINGLLDALRSSIEETIDEAVEELDQPDDKKQKQKRKENSNKKN